MKLTRAANEENKNFCNFVIKSHEDIILFDTYYKIRKLTKQ